MWRLVACLIVVSFSGVSAGAAKPKKEVLVTFAGVLKRVTKHDIVIEPEADNQMTFLRTKRTVFLSGGRPIDGGGLPREIVVNVQAFEKLNRELEAVTVTVALPDQSPNK